MFEGDVHFFKEESGMNMLNAIREYESVKRVGEVLLNLVIYSSLPDGTSLLLAIFKKFANTKQFRENITFFMNYYFEHRKLSLLPGEK